MQKTAISLTSRSAVLSRAFSVWQPDFRILWNTSTFHLRAYQCSFSIAAAQVGTGKSVISRQSMAGRSAGSVRSLAQITVRLSADSASACRWVEEREHG